MPLGSESARWAKESTYGVWRDSTMNDEALIKRKTTALSIPWEKSADAVQILIQSRSLESSVLSPVIIDLSIYLYAVDTNHE